MNQHLIELMIPLLKKYKEDKEKEGLVPTVELLIEDLESDREKDPSELCQMCMKNDCSCDSDYENSKN